MQAIAHPASPILAIEIEAGKTENQSASKISRLL
jgi:hypothetical protein